MMAGWFNLPPGGRFRLADATVPGSVVRGALLPAAGPDGLVRLDIDIADGRIAGTTPAGTTEGPVAVDLAGAMVLPAFVDAHTHLDKAFSAIRAPNPDGSFDGALATNTADHARWRADEQRARAEFALRCAEAHGTRALRSFVDTTPEIMEMSWPNLAELRDDWGSRITVQLAAIAPAQHLVGPDGRRIARLVADHGGILGSVGMRFAGETEAVVDRIFALAAEFDLDLDFHADETLDPASSELAAIAGATLRHVYEGRVTCGHCCALTLQDEAVQAATIAAVAEAGIHVVTLPPTNLYLQDRRAGRTPRYRGLTLIHEMKAAGITLGTGSDNSLDPFYIFGDLDMLAVLTDAVRLGHLDHPTGDWVGLAGRGPAEAMGLSWLGLVAPGLAADLVLCRARNFPELFSRPQADRVVLRDGQRLDAIHPDYRELDPWFAAAEEPAR
ncbi:MAG: cytosine deaminase [Alphaproteobacteria bacterium]|jgi:cytosine deaminase|nr:cytosine deaminase [Alphaproteobacteria bacterium]